MRIILFSLLVVSALAPGSKAQNPYVSGQFDFDAVKETLGGMVQRTDCTPICGNPTCCIALQQTVVTHKSDVVEEQFWANVKDLGMTKPMFEERASVQPELFEEVGMIPLIDYSDFLRGQSDLMEAANEIGFLSKCSVCCYSCGSSTCCGGCWNF